MDPVSCSVALWVRKQTLVGCILWRSWNTCFSVDWVETYGILCFCVMVWLTHTLTHTHSLIHIHTLTHTHTHTHTHTQSAPPAICPDLDLLTLCLQPTPPNHRAGSHLSALLTTWKDSFLTAKAATWGGVGVRIVQMGQKVSQRLFWQLFPFPCQRYVAWGGIKMYSLKHSRRRFCVML